MDKKTVLSGIRATGRLHLGNYLGAIKGMLALQDSGEYKTFYMVADAHSITTPYNKEELVKNRRDVILDYLAAGLDPEKSTIFIQSMIPEHFELMHYLSSVITVSRMQHLPTFKDKIKQQSEEASMALLNYPVLMAADILAYKAALVPVGVDQEPHLEVARQIARNMNARYGTDFPEPLVFKTEGTYIPSLLGVGKMSKSVEGSFINLTDDLETIKTRLAKVPTDSGKNGTIRVNSNFPENEKGYEEYESDIGVKAVGTELLMEFIGTFVSPERKREYQDMYRSSSGVSYSKMKEEIAEAIYEALKPMQDLRKEKETVFDDVINEGAKAARAESEKTLIEVKEKMGFV